MKCEHENAKLFHVCDKCGKIKTPSSHVDYFQFFGLSPAYFLDESKVQSEFYSLSKVLHPDRFHGKSFEQFETATQSFAILNKALTTLKSASERAHYLFELSHFTPKVAKGALPPDLAEEYFELQESLEDGHLPIDERESLVNHFSQSIKEKIREAESRRDQAFKEWEQNGHPLDERAAPYFENASREMNQRSYLKSMAADLEKRFQAVKK